MSRPTLKRLLVALVLLMLLAGLGYARWDNYQLDGDALSFMDIADAIRAGDWPRVVNAYWNPLYAAALAAGQAIARPSRWTELQVFYSVNFVIFAACLFATMDLVRAMVQLRARAIPDSGERSALSPLALQFVSLALLFFSFQRELSLAKVRSDALLLFFLLLATAALMRIQATGKLRFFALLGLWLGLAFLTKSFAFLPTVALLFGMVVYGMFRGGLLRRRILVGVALAAAVFTVPAGPYIVAVSRQVGHFSTGESGSLNYAFDVDGTVRFHTFNYPGGAGHARMALKHPEKLLLASPAVYAYSNHAWGTAPLWFDPSFWHDRVWPRWYLPGQIDRLKHTPVQLVRFLVGHPEGFALILVLLLAGYSFRYPHPRETLPLLVPVAWGLLMLSVYMLVDLEDRYLTGMLLLSLLPVVALLRRPESEAGARLATCLAVLLAVLSVADAARDLGERRRNLSVAGYPSGAWSPEIYGAAHGLVNLGLKPGEPVACLGDQACYPDPYWARLAHTQLLAQVDTLNRDPAAIWRETPNQGEVIDALRREHIRFLVAIFPPAAQEPAGWVQLGATHYFALPIPQ